MSVVIDAPARLHLGFYNFFNEDVAYGSIGLALEEPKVVVKAINSQESRIINETNVYVDDVVSKVLNRLGAHNLEIRIKRAIPRHVGLGSTTQLSLALGTAIMRTLGKPTNVKELAVILGRGRDSGIGILAFQHGGFIVDSGRRVHGDLVEPPKSIHDLPHPIFRAKIPKNWYFIIAIPRTRVGLDEIEERRVMDIPHPLPREDQHRLYELLLLKLIPSIMMRDAKLFGETITRLQMIVGTYFSRYQGGIFCCEETEFLVNSFLKYGAYGAGQSSWGPTVYGIIEGYNNAIKLLSRIKMEVKERGYEVDIFVTRGRNRGAVIINEYGSDNQD